MSMEHNPTVLVTDDEAEIRDIIIESIKPFGYNILQAENGQKALELIETHDIDVALLDIAMPVMSGIELLKKVKSKNPSATCLMVTAFGNKEMIKEALVAGAFDFIEKPFNPATLANRVERAVQSHERERINEIIVEEFLLSYSPNITKKQFDEMEIETKKRVLSQGLALIQLKRAKREI